MFLFIFYKCDDLEHLSLSLSLIIIFLQCSTVYSIVDSLSYYFRYCYILQHDQIVSGIDWSRSSNKIVTVSHDRNS